jgi:hypothetical protein
LGRLFLLWGFGSFGFFPYFEGIMITLTFASWVIPLIITLIVFSYSTFSVVSDKGSWFSGLSAFIFHGIALVISLASWLIWALFKLYG